jgi:ribonuclease HI
MQSALKRKIKNGQNISCVFLEDFYFLNDRDYERYILMDRHQGGLKISLSDRGLDSVHKIFADRSFFEEKNRAAYGGFLEDPGGNRVNFSRSFSGGSGNLMELLGVTEGLEQLRHIPEIQVCTDSRFVIRGLVQWVHFWRHNDWQTAYGRSVKYSGEWKRIDNLCEGKRIQFKWIKGHSGHESQDYCHQMAQNAVLGNKKEPFF